MTSINVENDVQEIRRIRHALQEAENSRNAQAFRTLMTDDVRAQRVNEPELKGLEAIIETYEKAWAKYDSVYGSTTTEGIRVLGNYAVEWGRYWLRRRPSGAATDEEAAGEYLFTFEKDGAGAWKVHRTSWTVETDGADADGAQP